MQIKKANQHHLSDIVKMLSDDVLGQSREHWADPLPQCYLDAFEMIDQDPHQELLVMLDGDDVIGTLQLTFISSLTLMGSLRAQVEGVRIKSTHRGQGLGRQFFEYAIQRAKEKDCSILQLTTNAERREAIKFYESLGFKASHVGMKLNLS